MPEAWEGDFRQFNLLKYKTLTTKLHPQDWDYLILFSQLQPNERYKADYDKFIQANPQIRPLIENNRQKIINYWPVFLQIWQYLGKEGVEQFISRPAPELQISSYRASEILLANLSPDLKKWISILNFDENYLRAIGQIYYRYGDKGLTLLFSKLRQIEAALGRDFFEHFNQHILRTTKNFSYFITEKFFTSMDDMIAKLKPHQAQGQSQAWRAIMVKHMEALGWDSPEALWKGFSYFIDELDQIGLELEGTEFDRLPPENMLMCMDRILASINRISDINLKKLFLKNLVNMDLTHGGVHYALQHEDFKQFDKELKLHSFEQGTPTYSPDLVKLYEWKEDEAVLKMKRTLASKPQFSHSAYTTLANSLSAEIESRNKLIWLLHTQYNVDDIRNTVQQLEKISPASLEFIARHLHHAVYMLGNATLAISLDAMLVFITFCPSLDRLQNLFRRFQNGTILESLSILHKSKSLSPQTAAELISLFETMQPKHPSYPEFLYNSGFKLATLFKATQVEMVAKFHALTTNLLPVVQNELRLLFSQLLSVDYENSEVAALNPR